MRLNIYAVVNAEGAKIGEIKAPCIKTASDKLNFKYNNLACFLRLRKIGEKEITK